MIPDFKLYLITDRKQTRLPLVDAVRLALQGGVKAIQLREKDLPVRELLGVARELRSLCHEFGAKLFVNDRIDVAIAVNADGVHLSHAGLPAGPVRKMVGRALMIGVSTHSLVEAEAAQAGGADFITFGPVFLTPSKVQYGAPVGLNSLKFVSNQIKIPVFGLGGIKSGNVSQVLASGAFGVSLISAIIAADDVRKSAESIVTKIV